MCFIFDPGEVALLRLGMLGFGRASPLTSLREFLLVDKTMFLHRRRSHLTRATGGVIVTL